MSAPSSLVLVAEDVLSRAILVRLVREAERRARNLPALDLSLLPPRRGKDRIRQELIRYQNASRSVPHVVLVDLDRDACAPRLRHEWGLVSDPPGLLFRIAVREAEAWLLADQQGFAAFAGVPIKKIPDRPEDLDDPKQALINIVRRSRNRRLAEELVPMRGSAVSIGPLYNERLSAFADATWNPAIAAAAAPSLAKAQRRLQEMIDRFSSR